MASLDSTQVIMEPSFRNRNFLRIAQRCCYLSQCFLMFLKADVKGDMVTFMFLVGLLNFARLATRPLATVMHLLLASLADVLMLISCISYPDITGTSQQESTAVL